MRGQVWVGNGQVLVDDPPEGGTPATITPPTGFLVLVNGQEAAGQTPVRSGAEITLQSQLEIQSGRLNVEISPDEMQAWIIIEPEVRMRHRFADQPPTADLLLTIETETVHALPWTVSQVVARLQEQGVVFGLQHDNIVDFLAHGLGGSFLAAQGLQPIPPVHEEIEILFDTESRQAPTLRQDGTVDFKDLQRFFSVSPGTILGIKHKAVPGKAGTTVTGKSLPPPKPEKLALEPGPYTEVTPDELMIKASAGGQPRLHKDEQVYRFEINPLLEHLADVNLKSGNIYFKGSVKIVGSVMEGMTVQADGRVEIHGAVTGAVIQGGQGVVIRGPAFSSEIRAGGKGAHLAGYLMPLRQLITDYEQALSACRQFMQNATATGQQVTAGQMLLRLLDHRFKSVPYQVKRLHEMLLSNRKAQLWLPENLEWSITAMAHTILRINVVSIRTIKPLMSILQGLRQAGNELQQLQLQPSDVELASTAGSVVEATGSVRIGAQGISNSIVCAGNNVDISGPLKGGRIQAKKDVWVAAAGSARVAVKTVIQTEPGGKIKLDVAYPGVVIQVDNRSTNVETPLRQVTAELKPDTNRIELTSMPF